MSLAREYENRMIGNIEGVFVAIIAGAFAVMGEALSEVAVPTDSTTADGSISTLLFTIQNYPTIILLVALAAVTISAGPFGLLGFAFEVAGASVFLSDPIAGLVLFAVGAGIIVVGARVWKWTWVLKWFLSSRQRGRRRGYGRR